MASQLHISSRPNFGAAVKLLVAAQLPTEDLTAAHCDHFFFAGSPTEPTGLVGLELFADVGLLRSLVVVPDRRGTGQGAALLKHAEDYARVQGIAALYLLTTTAESFFAKHGYRCASRESAPAAIRATREFADICPANSAFMMRQLS